MTHDPSTVPAQSSDPAASPNVQNLIEEFKRCSPCGSGSSWNRVRTNEDIRFSRWAGQSPDGKKRDQATTKAFPWDGASDQRIGLADDIINGIGAECWEAFWRAWTAQKAAASEEDGYAIKLLEFYVTDLLFAHLYKQVDLSAQYRETYGWVALHPTWEREISLEYRKVKLEDLVRLAQQVGQAQIANPSPMMMSETPSPLTYLPQSIMDPSQDETTAQTLGELYGRYAAAQVKELANVEAPPLSTKALKTLVRELREEGESQVPIPFLVKNQPACYALKPWEEFFIPGYTTAGQKARVMFQRVWMSEADLRANVLVEHWSEAWVTEALKHKGKWSTWNSDASSSPSVDLSAAMSAADTISWNQVETKLDMVEVVFGTYRQLDDNNVPGIYVTIFNPMVCQDPANEKKELCAWHGLLGDTRGKYPYVIGQRENIQPNITASRGVPEIVCTYQRALKSQADAAIDWASIGVLPPVNVYQSAMGTKYRFGPAVQNTVKMGQEPKFMNVPGNGVPVAFELINKIEFWCDRYFGRANPAIPPTESGSRKQKSIGSFLMMWTEALCQVLELAQFNLSDDQFTEITGAPAGWLDSHRQQAGLLTAWLHFDVRELDPAFVMQQLKTINEAVIPGDVAGVIDRAKYTQFQLRAINPQLARSLVSDTTAASQKIFESVRDDIAMMFLGNEPHYVEMDPTAQTKLQNAQQIVGANPNYVNALRQDPKGRFAELLQKYVANLQFSLTQEQNKTVGAIGVKPQSPGMPGMGQGMGS